MSIRKLGLGGLATVVWVALLGALALPAAFAAPPAAPHTGSASSVTGTSAILEGSLNPAAAAPKPGWYFAYSNPEGASCLEGPATAQEPEEPAVEGEAIAVGPTEIAGLEPSRKYLVCLVAINQATGETEHGNEVSIATKALAPTAEALTATGVTPFAARLEALANAQNQPTECKFEYGTTKAVKLAKEAPCEQGTVPGTLEGYGNQGVSLNLAGLESTKTYYYRLLLKNGTGAFTPGPEGEFTTLTPETPVLVSQAVSGITPFEAHLEGALNPNYQLTTCHFVTTAPEAEPACEPETFESFGEMGFGKTLTGLTPATTYHFHSVAKNATGKVEGEEAEFTTLTAEKPIVSAETSSAVTSTDATLNATVNPNYQDTHYYFQYSTSSAVAGSGSLSTPTPVPALPGTDIGSAFEEHPVSNDIGGVLAPRTPYFYQVVAENATGTSYGAVETFTTLATPLLTVAPAEHITRTTATLSGTVNPGGVPTRYHFVYVEAAHFLAGAGECGEGHPACAYEGEGSRSTPQSESVGSDYTAHAAGPTQIGELKTGTTYYYVLVATSSEGSTVGPNQEFTTSPATPPSASTGEASAVTQLSATISGTADTQGLPGTLSFQVALSPEGGSLEAATVSGSESGTSVSITFSFGPYLQPGTTYYYRAYATNADGTAAGEWRSFTTGTFLSPFPASTPFPLLSVPAETKETPVKVTPRLTRAQKLTKALKACHRVKKSKRKNCERTARSKYGPRKHKK